MAGPRTRQPPNRGRGGGILPRTSDEDDIAGETQSRPAGRRQGGPIPAKKKKNKKKAPKGDTSAVKSGAQKGEEIGVNLTSKQEKRAAPDLLSNPEAKGRGLINDDRTETEPMPGSKTTSRGECSGQKKLDS
jgi:hypothetical protein